MDVATEKYLDAKFDAITDSIHNNREIFTLRLDAIIEHNEKQNGWIKTHTEDIEKLQDHARSCKSQRKTIKMIGRRWWLVLVAMIIISGGTTWGYHHLKINKISIGPVEMGFEKESVRGGEVN